MLTDFRSECLDLLRQIRIESPDTVRIGNEEFCWPADSLVSYLQNETYKRFFCGQIPNEKQEPQMLFMSALTAANRGKFGRRESLTDQPGTYLAFGRAHLPGTKWLRIYWNVSALGAVILTSVASAGLNRLGVAFQLKVMLDTGFRRRDAAVLYLPLDMWQSAQALIPAVCRQLEDSGDLHDDIPLFTKQLRPGVALAEDPQKGWSFGLHRCWLVARALTRGFTLGHTDEEQKWEDLVAEFAMEGLAIDQPYLNSGSRDIYLL